MNIQSKYPTTPDEFLRWNEGREGKREFVNGRVVEMMINVTRNHFFLASRLLNQLSNQLGLVDYIVGSADFGVKTDAGIRYPDILVEAAGGPGQDLATSNPILIAEVLSPSTMASDFGPKASEYLAIPSLQHYLTVSQTEARVWVWTRDADGAWQKPEIVEAEAVALALDGQAISIDIKALYLGIAQVQPTQ